MSLALSVVVPTYCRERVLMETLGHVRELMGPDDELLVIDQTPRHEPETTAALGKLVEEGRVRWYHKRRAGQVEAMNVGAQLARNEGLVFLDDDVIPGPAFLAAHREALTNGDAPAFAGQVLQPWHAGPLQVVADHELGFDPAYDQACDVVHLIEGNFAIRREEFLACGGMDQNFGGSAYRHGTELAYRLVHRTGRRIRFLPEASLRHLQANAGGQRAHGLKDTWGHIGGSVGDYYFALRWLPFRDRVRHDAHRLRAESLNNLTVRRPWLVPSLALREVVAWWWARWLLFTRPANYVKPLAQYDDVAPHPDGQPRACSERAEAAP